MGARARSRRDRACLLSRAGVRASPVAVGPGVAAPRVRTADDREQLGLRAYGAPTAWLDRRHDLPVGAAARAILPADRVPRGRIVDVADAGAASGVHLPPPATRLSRAGTFDACSVISNGSVRSYCSRRKAHRSRSDQPSRRTTRFIT